VLKTNPDGTREVVGKGFIDLTPYR
jgi:hypothetical protein